MPILIRPVREQLEHDRVIRLLQAKWKKTHDAQANVGDERKAFLKIGQMTVFPDLILANTSAPRKLQAVVEVETGESVNHLEALAQWTHMSRAKAPFQLYVPIGAVDQARRLCEEHQVSLAEMWSYYVLGEQVRFTRVQRNDALAGNLPKGKPDKARAADGENSDIVVETLGPLEIEPAPAPVPVAAPEPAPMTSRAAATAKSAPAAAPVARKAPQKTAAKPVATPAAKKTARVPGKTAPKAAAAKKTAAKVGRAKGAKPPAAPARSRTRAKREDPSPGSGAPHLDRALSRVRFRSPQPFEDPGSRRRPKREVAAGPITGRLKTGA